MHIAYYTNSYLPYISGVVRSVQVFRRALAQRGNNVFIFAQEASDYEDTEPFIFRYPTLPIPLPGDFPTALPISPFIDRLFPYLKIEVIHAHHPVLLGFTALVRAKEYGLPLVFTFHSNYEEYSSYIPLQQNKAQEFIKEAIDALIGMYMLSCHHIVAPSRSMYDYILSKYDILPEGISIVPTGIELKPYQGLKREAIRKDLGWEGHLILISVGRLAIEKNLETLLRSCAAVMQTNTALKLVLAGDGPERKNLETLTEALGMVGRVEFLGKVPFEKVPEYLVAADIFVFASIAETQGLVTMEALSAGLPVAAVKGTGTVDVIEHGKQGLLSENDPLALAAAIQQLVEDPDLRCRLRDSALIKADSFEVSKQAVKMENVYCRAVKAHKQGHTIKINQIGEWKDTLGLKIFFPLLFPRENEP